MAFHADVLRGSSPAPQKTACIVPGSQIVGKTPKKKAREKLSWRGGKKEKEGREPPLLSPVSSRFIFVFALSQFSGLDYLGAWNRLQKTRLHVMFILRDNMPRVEEWNFGLN